MIYSINKFHFYNKIIIIQNWVIFVREWVRFTLVWVIFIHTARYNSFSIKQIDYNYDTNSVKSLIFI